MVTLRKIAAEIIRTESGGDQSNDSQLSEAYVILMIRQVLNKMLAPMIFNNLNSDDRGSLPLVIASYTVTVLGSLPNKYIDLPEFYQHLPFNKGLYGIAPVDDRTNHFIPRRTPSVSRNLPCADLEPGQNSYFTEGLRVYFHQDMSLNKVLVKLVVIAPDSIGINDSLPIYPEMQADVILLVRQLILGTPVQDRRLDNNPDIGIKVAR
jgi:hypothetical protein